MAAVLQDLKLALRLFLKQRGFTAAAITVLALGIGANSAIFSVVNAVLLRQIPFANPDRIVLVFHKPPAKLFPGSKRFAVSPANYLDWRTMSKSFDGMAAYAPRQAAITGLDHPEAVKAAWVGGDFFRIVGVQPQLGRLFTDADDRPDSQRVAVISDGFWKSHFGASPTALGRTLIVNGVPFSIVGVAPPTMHLPAWSLGAADIWMPLAWANQLRAERKNHNFLVVARLRAGVPVSAAQAEMDAISHQLENQYPDADRDWGAVVEPLRDNLVNNVRPILLVLLGAVAFVLLISCANVANLIMARNLARRKEMAVRAALGASRGRALQQLLCESMLLSFTGGLAGLALAKLATPMLIQFVSRQFTLDKTIPLDASVMLFTLGITVATAVLAGALPAWRGSQTDLNDALKQGGARGGSDFGAQRTRSVLVALEVAFSLILLTGAGLMVRTLWLLTGVDPGFDPNNVLSLTVMVPNPNLTDKTGLAPAAAFYGDVLRTARALPGVESAGMIDNLPLTGGSVQPFVIEGRPAPPFSQQPTVKVRAISPGYLPTMRIPVLHGRDMTESDVAARQPVVLISETMARQFWPVEDPLGKRIDLSFFPGESYEVIGIVADIKSDGLDSLTTSPMLYQAAAQTAHWPMTVVIRTANRPEALAPAVTAAVQKLTPDQPLRDVRTLQSLVDESISGRRMSMLLLAAFAALALLLSGFGLYSVLSYTVRRRVREIGIRVALGASVRDVLQIVAMDSFWPSASGIAIGLVGSFLLSTLLSSLVYGIHPRDPLTFLAGALMLTLAAIAASIVPAWRATRVDPLQALREE